MRWFNLRRGTELWLTSLQFRLTGGFRASPLTSVTNGISDIEQLLSVTRGDAGKLAPFSTFIIEPRLAWERVKSCSSVQACESE